MEKITNFTELNNAINALETELELREQLLKEQVIITFDSFKPVNLIAKILTDISPVSKFLKDNSGIILALATSYMANTPYAGRVITWLQRIIGFSFKSGISDMFSQNDTNQKTRKASLLERIIHHFQSNIGKK
jgi:hypothetical protein